MKFDRDVYFDMVKGSLFGGKLTQQQVDGQNGILAAWETYVPETVDLRWLAYMLATSMHETAATMWPIEEYGKGSGMEYGKPAGPYNEIYYGRGFVQLTWWDNYVRADTEMKWTGDKSCERYPDNQLKPEYAAPTMYLGMRDGWFRQGHNLPRYFSDTVDDAYGAREIINGDKSIIPSWSNGVKIGDLIAGYHEKFRAAVEESVGEVGPEPIPLPTEDIVVTVNIFQPPGVRVEVTIDEG
jgi:putative chitinase